MSETPQERGRKFEKAFADALSVEVQKGSGNQWTAKMDVADGAILWSCKHTDGKSFRLSVDLMKEAQDAIIGPGGIGGDAIPGVATHLEDSDDVFVTLRAEDFLRMVTNNVRYITPSKGEQKRATAKVPLLLRDEDEDVRVGGPFGA